MRWNVDDGGRPATRRDWLRAAPLALGGLLGAARLGRAQQAQGRARPPARPAAPANAPAQGAPAQANLNALLNQWQQRSKDIHTLDAKFKRTDINELFKNKKVYLGRALLKDNPNRAFLDLQLIDPNNPKKEPVFADRIVCDGEAVYQFAAATQTIQGYPLPKNDQQRALEEGPLRFLFNMQAAQVKERYTIRLIKQLPNAFQLQIVPKMAQDRNAFAQAVVQLNSQTFLPEVMTLVLSNNKEIQQYQFTSVEPNKEVMDVNFEVKKKKPPAGWKLVMNPPPDQAAANAAAEPPPRFFRPAPGVRQR